MQKNLVVVGKSGEDVAVSFLKKKGYKVVERNFRTRNGEIDIICIYKNILVFVEVKTRSSEEFGTPFEAITPYKVKFITRAAEYYKATHTRLPDLLRIDAIAVIISPSGMVDNIDHIESIF